MVKLWQINVINQPSLYYHFSTAKMAIYIYNDHNWKHHPFDAFVQVLLLFWHDMLRKPAFFQQVLCCQKCWIANGCARQFNFYKEGESQAPSRFRQLYSTTDQMRLSLTDLCKAASRFIDSCAACPNSRFLLAMTNTVGTTKANLKPHKSQEINKWKV